MPAKLDPETDPEAAYGTLSGIETSKPVWERFQAAFIGWTAAVTVCLIVLAVAVTLVGVVFGLGSYLIGWATP